ncbi:MAG: hypothetical protein BWK79_15375 [Beggiatoa sp. IS2]|nr:MAG: hypothetical protein BWK79_15375 [Beggiatoa sp. IS2]
MDALKNNQSYLENLAPIIVNLFNDGVIIYNAEGRIILANPRAEKLLGFHPLTDHNHWSLQMVYENGTAFPHDKHPVQIALRTGRNCIETMGIHRKDESLVWLVIEASPLRLADTSIIVSFLKDISEHKYMEEGLHERMFMLSSVFETAHIGIAVIDESGRFLRVNPTYCQLCGYRAEELLGQLFSLLLPAVLRTEAIQWYSTFLAGQAENSGIESIQHREGYALNCSIVERRISSSEHHLGIMFITPTSSQSAPAPAQDFVETSSWFKNIFSHSTLTVLKLDRQGLLTFAQGQHLESLGLASEEMIGQSVFEASQHLKMLVPDIQHALSGESFNKVVNHAGLSLQVQYLPLLEEHKWIGTLMILTDITEQRNSIMRLKGALHELKLLTARIPLGILYIEARKIIRANQLSATLLGYTQAELLKTTVDHFYSSMREYTLFQQKALPFISKSQSYSVEQTLRKKDGSSVYCKITVEPLNQPSRTLWLLEEIFHEKQQEQDLSSVLLAVAEEAILVTDTNLFIQRVNAQVCQLTGYSAEELMGQPLQKLDAGRSDTTQSYQQILDGLTQHRQWQGETWQRHKKGTAYLCRLKLKGYNTDQGTASHYIVLLNSQSDQQTLGIDSLTELPNRELFRFSLLKTLSLAQRASRRFAVLLVSIDGIAAINHQYGYAIGDLFLHRIGQNLKATVRDSDTVARYEGDIFGASLDEITQPPDAGLVGQMMLFKLTQPQTLLNEHKIQSSISIGIAVYPENGDTVETLLILAQRALQRARELGGGQCCFYDPKLQELYQ